MSWHARGVGRPICRAGMGVVMLCIVACTDGQADPGPTEVPPGTTSIPAASPTDDAPTSPDVSLDQQMAVDLFIDWRDLVYGVPPTAPEKLDVEGAGTDLVVDGSPAEQWVEEQLTEAKEDPRLTPRGDVRAEVLEIMTGGSADEQRASLCVSEAAQFTDMATGEVTSDAPAAIRTYQRFEVAYAREGANWLIESATAGDPQLCVPPSLEAAITKNWEAFTQAWADWERRGAPPDDLGKLTELTTQPLQDVLQAGNGIEPVSPNAQAPATDLRLERATRDRVEGTWCRGEALEGAWELIGNEWLLTYGPTTAPASEVPRC